MYLTRYKPFEERNNNRIEMVNEIFVLIATESMLLYTPILESLSQVYMRWFNVAAFTVPVLMNSVLLFYKTSLPIILYCKKYKLKHEHK